MDRWERRQAKLENKHRRIPKHGRFGPVLNAIQKAVERAGRKKEEKSEKKE